jgi:hypothetical protein
MSDEKRKVSYFNTLIFTLAAGIVSILLLALLFFKGFKEYLPFIIALEVGIFSIIALCITQIMLNESYLNKLKQMAGYQMTFDKCPDYFTKRDSGDKEICSSDYIYKDKGNKNWIMKIYPEDNPLEPMRGSRPLPVNLTLDYRGDEQKYEKFPLHEIEKETSFKTYADKCKPLTGDSQDPKLAYLKGYNLVPWTTMNSKCASSM